MQVFYYSNTCIVAKSGVEKLGNNRHETRIFNHMLKITVRLHVHEGWNEFYSLFNSRKSSCFHA